MGARSGPLGAGAIVSVLDAFRDSFAVENAAPLLSIQEQVSGWFANAPWTQAPSFACMTFGDYMGT